MEVRSGGEHHYIVLFVAEFSIPKEGVSILKGVVPIPKARHLSVVAEVSKHQATLFVDVSLKLCH
jgi:hypothetical protein